MIDILIILEIQLLLIMQCWYQNLYNKTLVKINVDPLMVTQFSMLTDLICQMVCIEVDRHKTLYFRFKLLQGGFLSYMKNHIKSKV